MTKHKNLAALCLFLRHLSASLDCKNAQLELASLNLWTLDYSSGSEFSGFVSEDENIAKKKLLFAQQRLSENTDISEMSDVTVDISENSDTESFDSNYVDQVLETLNDSSLFLQSIDVNELDNMSDNENDGDDEGDNDAGDQKNDDDDDNDDDDSNVDENYDYFTDFKNVSDTDESGLDDNTPLSRLKSKYNGNASIPNCNTNYDTEDDIPLAALRSAVQPSRSVDKCIERVSSVNQCENSNLNTQQPPRTENEITCNIEQENPSFI
ncbi:putative uncharacterized protein DDB_G0287265 [Mercenaria mercenaria]|uniref:putative uncharacterized protein DDB_G0287265 n=1 Tax=Mercenaria mercenaria TaxID=6596 RepID=UPI00234E87FF|nr:putative uncharacterized protein DDB_G0287265 [Mercenaria mercenaria]